MIWYDIPSPLTTIPVISLASNLEMATSSAFCRAAFTRSLIRPFKSMERPKSWNYTTQSTQWKTEDIVGMNAQLVGVRTCDRGVPGSNPSLADRRWVLRKGSLHAFSLSYRRRTLKSEVPWHSGLTTCLPEHFGPEWFQLNELALHHNGIKGLSFSNWFTALIIMIGVNSCFLTRRHSQHTTFTHVVSFLSVLCSSLTHRKRQPITLRRQGSQLV